MKMGECGQAGHSLRDCGGVSLATGVLNAQHCVRAYTHAHTHARASSVATRGRVNPQNIHLQHPVEL